MSGVTSSKRQWASLRVRAIAALLLALAMLIPAVSVVMAQDDGTVAPAATWGPYAGANKLCITGTVINFDETPLAFGRDGESKWQITAASVDDPAAAVLSTETDEDGHFEFTEGLDVGRWTISIVLQEGWRPVLPYTESFDVTLDYGAKECTKVRFKLVYPITVTVYKVDDNHIPLEGWTIRAAPAPRQLVCLTCGSQD